MRTINRIIIHCSATRPAQKVDAKTINSWHIAQGYRCIGYHFVVNVDGSVEDCAKFGRPVSQVGAHCLNHNNGSIGICYVGGLDGSGKAKDTRTEAQKKALRELVRELCEKFPTISDISGHNEFANKACPCFNVKEEKWI